MARAPQGILIRNEINRREQQLKRQISRRDIRGVLGLSRRANQYDFINKANDDLRKFAERGNRSVREVGSFIESQSNNLRRSNFNRLQIGKANVSKFGAGVAKQKSKIKVFDRASGGVRQKLKSTPSKTRTITTLVSQQEKIPKSPTSKFRKLKSESFIDRRIKASAKRSAKLDKLNQKIAKEEKEAKKARAEYYAKLPNKFPKQFKFAKKYLDKLGNWAIDKFSISGRSLMQSFPQEVIRAIDKTILVRQIELDQASKGKYKQYLKRKIAEDLRGVKAAKSAMDEAARDPFTYLAALGGARARNTYRPPKWFRNAVKKGYTTPGKVAKVVNKINQGAKNKINVIKYKTGVREGVSVIELNSKGKIKTVVFQKSPKKTSRFTKGAKKITGKIKAKVAKAKEKAAIKKSQKLQQKAQRLQKKGSKIAIETNQKGLLTKVARIKVKPAAKKTVKPSVLQEVKRFLAVKFTQLRAAISKNKIKKVEFDNKGLIKKFETSVQTKTSKPVPASVRQKLKAAIKQQLLQLKAKINFNRIKSITFDAKGNITQLELFPLVKKTKAKKATKGTSSAAKRSIKLAKKLKQSEPKRVKGIKQQEVYVNSRGLITKIKTFNVASLKSKKGKTRVLFGKITAPALNQAIRSPKVKRVLKVEKNAVKTKINGQTAKRTSSSSGELLSVIDVVAKPVKSKTVLRQVNRGKPTYSIKLARTAAVASLSKLRNNARFNNALRNLQNINEIVTNKEAQEIAQNIKQIEEIIVKQGSTNIQSGKQIQRQGQRRSTKQLQKTKTKLSNKTKPPSRPRVKLGIPKLPAPVSNPKGYDVYIRRAGKYYRYNPKSLTKASAEKFGRYLVNNTVRASYYLVGIALKGSKAPKYATSTPKKYFRTPKKKSRLKSNVRVEKRKYRINTKGEKKGLTVPKLLKSVSKAKKKKTVKKKRTRKRKV